MKRILVLLSDPGRAQLVRQLLEAAGVQAAVTDSAMAALTELERTQVDAVICGEDAGDMSGEDFRDILRYEPATRRTPVYLLTRQAGQQRAESPNHDLLPGISTASLVREVMDGLGLDAAAGTHSFLCAETSGDLRGGLGDVTLAELLSWVAELELNGHWMIESGPQQGYLLMNRGNVTYAEFGEYAGHAALLELMDSAAQDPQAQFRFCRAEWSGGPVPCNITERTERLLMEVTVDLDHRNAERAASAPA